MSHDFTVFFTICFPSLVTPSHITIVDFSDSMISKAREKIITPNVNFVKADITKDWFFLSEPVDLISCSLVLEHIQQIESVFRKASNALKQGGLFYIGELHPFKQYLGSKARFETANGMFESECFTHHISDYFECAADNGFQYKVFKEWFDGDDKNAIPRIVSFLFGKWMKVFSFVC